MQKGFNIKNLLLAIPLIYIGLGWYVGINYGCKPITFGPYPDIPVAVKTGQPKATSIPPGKITSKRTCY